MAFELRAETGNARGSIARVGHRLGINTETLRNWVNKAEVHSGQRPGTTTGDQKRIATPASALQAGADLLVIGRPVTAAPDPEAALSAILAEAASDAGA